jgi:hypothetical protein
MTLCDYFSAPDDAAAAAVIGTPGGPLPAGFDAISLPDIDPVVVLGRLEAIMADRAGGEAGGRPTQAAQLVSEPDSEGPFVFRISDALTAALATAAPDDLARGRALVAHRRTAAVPGGHGDGDRRAGGAGRPRATRPRREAARLLLVGPVRRYPPATPKSPH